jgi:hypothetical protein
MKSREPADRIVHQLEIPGIDDVAQNVPHLVPSDPRQAKI